MLSRSHFGSSWGFASAARPRQSERLRLSIPGTMAKKDGGNKSVLDLERYLNQSVKVKFSGGREVRGILKGHDAVANLVLDDVQEYLRDPEDPYKVAEETRSIGLVVARGTSVMLICPVDGTEEIANPFASA
mmetsp:Transcript_56408/g.121940  ORF Transcript_56408/g.121940 Transcript_56408/m.121940 type:complete len:132 (+) Transcript_56408:3-398(+)